MPTLTQNHNQIHLELIIFQHRGAEDMDASYIFCKGGSEFYVGEARKFAYKLTSQKPSNMTDTVI
jgi:hypothetical protein